MGKANQCADATPHFAADHALSCRPHWEERGGRRLLRGLDAGRPRVHRGRNRSGLFRLRLEEGHDRERCPAERLRAASAFRIGVGRRILRQVERAIPGVLFVNGAFAWAMCSVGVVAG